MPEEKEAFLSRWSRLKREGDIAPNPPATPVQAAPPTPVETGPAPEALPPIDSINVDTDISPYLQAKVDQGLKRMALKKLFQDPHFHFGNMDKLDIYIDDYSIPDPLPEGMLEQLKFAQDYLFKDPTKPETAEPSVVLADETKELPAIADSAERGGKASSNDEAADRKTEEEEILSQSNQNGNPPSAKI